MSDNKNKVSVQAYAMHTSQRVLQYSRILYAGALIFFFANRILAAMHKAVTIKRNVAKSPFWTWVNIWRRRFAWNLPAVERQLVCWKVTIRCWIWCWTTQQNICVTTTSHLSWPRTRGILGWWCAVEHRWCWFVHKTVWNRYRIHSSHKTLEVSLNNNHTHSSAHRTQHTEYKLWEKVKWWSDETSYLNRLKTEIISVYFLGNTKKKVLAQVLTNFYINYYVLHLSKEKWNITIFNVKKWK